ncbi:MAG: hypothetical protein FWC23_09140 [Chitinispirillia bacterium]|nr:hypothetical protein [Chitinispirillia bacterium]MCL2269333.1 hypothetical protein [Chitinispirillia bacterium]
MKTISRPKKFDCVKMKIAVQAQVYAETKDMAFDELAAYLGAHLRGNFFWEKINSGKCALPK